MHTEVTGGLGGLKRFSVAGVGFGVSLLRHQYLGGVREASGNLPLIALIAQFLPYSQASLGDLQSPIKLAQTAVGVG